MTMDGVTRQRLLTGSLLVLLLLLSLFLRFGLVYIPSLDFRPSPDAAEYAAAGLSLAEGRWLTLTMGGGVYPSRYPGGYPLVLALFHLLGLPVERFFLSSILLGLAAIPLVFLLARRAGSGRDAALLAAAVAACSPVLVFCSMRVLTENLSLVTLLAAFLLALRGGPETDGRAALLTLLAGAAAGYSVIVRLAGVVSLPVVFGLLLVLGRQAGKKSRRLVLDSLLFGCGLFAGILPQLVFNRINFGDLFSTGYGFWNQSFQDPLSMFEAAHVVHPWDTRYGNLWYYLQHLGGMTFEANFLKLYSLAAAVLAVVGLFAIFRRRRRRTLHLFGLLHCLATLALMLFFIGQSTRLLAAVIPWVALWAGEGFAALWHRPAGAPFPRSCRTAGALLALAAVVPLFIWIGSRTGPFAGDRPAVVTAAGLARERTPCGSLIFSNLSPVYTGMLVDFRGGREVVQLCQQEGAYVNYLLNASFNGEGPPLPQARFMPPLPGREPFQPLVLGEDELGSWRLKQVADALAARRPVFVLQNAEQPPFSEGWLAVRKFFVIKHVARAPGFLLIRVLDIRESASRFLSRTPLYLKLRLKDREPPEGGV